MRKVPGTEDRRNPPGMMYHDPLLKYFLEWLLWNQHSVLGHILI